MKFTEKWLIVLFLSMVILANVRNSVNQLLTLFRVNNIVKVQKVAVAALRSEKIRLEERISYAQSDEYLSRYQRKLEGIGDENDYWLIMPQVQDLNSVYPKRALKTTIPNWKQWLNLIVDSG